MDWQRRDAPTVLLGVALLASAALLLALTWNLTFFQDTWAFLLARRSFAVDDFLAPHNEHLVAIPVAITQLSLRVFGMTSALPEMAMMILTLLASGALLFAYVRRRTDPWLALMGTVLLLFLGSAWMILLWPFEIEFSGAVMAGLGMLLLLEREDRRGDAWACLLLIVSIGFGSLGICFAVAAMVDVFLKRDSRGWGRAYVAIVPLLLYLIWYAGWGHTAADHLTLHNVLMSPQYVFDGFASSVGAFFGLSNSPAAATGQPEWGRPLLIALIGLAIFGQWRRPGVPAGFWPVAAAALTYWTLAAFNYIPGREAASNRYVYAGVVFALLMAANLLQGVRLGRRGLLVAAGVTLLALGPNLAQMKDGANVLKEQTMLTRAAIAALEISRRTVPPDLVMAPEITGTLANVAIVPGPYLEAVEAYGSPAYSVEQLAAAPANGRHFADILLSKALPLAIETRPAGSPAGGRCTAVAPGTPQIRADPGVTTIRLAPGPEAELTARRFAEDEFPVVLGSLAGGSATQLRIPRDAAPRYPWRLHIDATQRALVCD